MTEPISPFIDGQWTDSSSSDYQSLFNPATGEKHLELPVGSAADVDRAVSSARQAFTEGRWSQLPPGQRQKILWRFADLIDAEAGQLDRLDALDMGKPISLATANATMAAELLRYNANAIEQLLGNSYPADPGCLITHARLPRGVVAAVVPWNFPTANAAIKLAPALAAGNSVILKPSEWSPRSALRLVALAQQAGLPPGVLNLVPGLGHTVGQALALHPDIDMISFTGSTATGQRIVQAAGQSNLKVVQAECGGKSPQIVFPDVDNLDSIAESISDMILVNQGQLCVAGSRLLVHQSIADALVEKIIPHFSRRQIGNPLDPQTTFGPLANQPQRDKVMAYIEAGRRDGANLVTGGQTLLPETGGCFIAPTLLDHVNPQNPVAREEIFGPVLAVTRFNNTEQAIALANATDYGLAATVWTNELTTGMQLARQVNSGRVTVNGAEPKAAWPHSLAIEPYGSSGLGLEGGLAGLESYCRQQVMWFNYG